jgi:hypothetical protein
VVRRGQGRDSRGVFGCARMSRRRGSRRGCTERREVARKPPFSSSVDYGPRARRAIGRCQCQQLASVPAVHEPLLIHQSRK